MENCAQFQPYARIEESDVAAQREAEFYTKSLPEKMTHKWKGDWTWDFMCCSALSKLIFTQLIYLDGGVVDPECGLEENAHVYSATINGAKVFYSVILGLVDIECNKNSFYRMQLLASNDQNL